MRECSYESASEFAVDDRSDMCPYSKKKTGPDENGLMSEGAGG